MARSLNRAQLIGNLTRDPELRYTPTGTPVCTFSLATNRSWKTETGEKREETEFHRIVAWNKLAELCSQFLTKGRKVYVEGRLTTRNWNAQDGTQRNTTEIVITDMILLDSRRPEEGDAAEGRVEEKETEEAEESKKESKKAPKKTEEKEEARLAEDGESRRGNSAPQNDEEVAPDDIPF